MFYFFFLSDGETLGADYCAAPDINALGFKGREVIGTCFFVRQAVPWIAGTNLGFCHTLREVSVTLSEASACAVKKDAELLSHRATVQAANELQQCGAAVPALPLCVCM